MKRNPNLVRKVTIWPIRVWTKTHFACRDSEGHLYCLLNQTVRFGTNGIKKQLEDFYPNAKITVDLSRCNGVFECSANQGRIIPSKITSPFDEMTEISMSH